MDMKLMLHAMILHERTIPGTTYTNKNDLGQYRDMGMDK